MYYLPFVSWTSYLQKSSTLHDQAITVIQWGRLINEMADIYKKTFSVKSKKRIYRFVAGELLLLFKCSIGCLDSKISLKQGNFCFKVIGQAFQELWHYETMHVNASLRVV